MSTRDEILVLHAAADGVKLVQVRGGRESTELTDVSQFSLSKKESQSHPLSDQTILDALAARVTEQRWTGRKVVCLIGGSMVACHYYDLPPLQGQALRQAAFLKLKQELHFDVAEAIVAVDTMGRRGSADKPQVRVRVTAMHGDRAAAAIEAVPRIGLELVGLSAAPSAIAALAQEAFQAEPGLTAVLYVDESLSTLVVLENGSPCVTTDLPIGLNDLTAAMMRPIIAGDNVIQLDEARATELRNLVGIPAAEQQVESLGVSGQRLLPLIEPALQKFAKHLTQWLTFAATNLQGGEIQAFRLVGPGTAIPNLAQALALRIRHDVRVESWLSGRASLTGRSEPFLLESCAPAAAAARSRSELPDLLPPEVRFKQKARRVRRAITFCGPVVAAAILAIAVLFQRVGAELGTSAGAQERQLEGVQATVGQNSRWVAEQEAVKSLQQRFDDFSNATPTWVGLFKELSVLLPAELQATEFVARTSEDGIKVTVDAAVFARQDGSGFDEVVGKSLLLLQRSTFFDRVQLLTANRNTGDKTSGPAGTLSIEVELSYPRKGSKA